MDPVTDLPEPDEARPAKRVRLDAPVETTEELQDEMIDDEGWDDIYGDSEPSTARDIPLMPELEQTVATTNVEEHAQASKGQENDDGVPIEAIDDGDELVAQEPYPASTQKPAARMLDDTAEIEVGEPHQDSGLETAKATEQTEAVEAIDGGNGTDSRHGSGEEPTASAPAIGNGDIAQSKPRIEGDPEFTAAAAAQRDNQEAEWRFDPSDAESSSDSDSSSEDSSDGEDSGSEGGYEMLDPATAAKILMSGEGDDEDGGKGKNSTGDHQPRTANEVKEEVVPKPNVIVTEDMKITYLGIVDRTVESLVLIKAETPGEYQVLEAGSVLCNEKREVLGAVAETLGRVQEPMYSVAFTNAKEIEDAGLEYGTKIYYVDSHSTFVFTQPLKNMKGTDASNIHDEEVGEDELEFSDDEKEAEYKRQKKAAKRGGRGGLSRSAFNEERATRSFGAPGHDSGQTFVNGSDAPQQQYGGGLSYDDGDVQEEFYSPLKRPDNLSQLMTGGMPPPRPSQGNFDRGRGRGRGFDRGRGRGDRGRGDRGRGDRGKGRGGGFDQRNQRGGRGDHGQDGGNRGGHAQQTDYRGNAHSFPDRHNNHGAAGQRQNSLPPKPNMQHSSSPPQPVPQQQYPAYQQYSSQTPNQQSYQFNGYTFQYGNAPPQQPPAPQAGYYNQQQSAQSPTGSIPPGAYVNPNFFQNQQMQGQWPQPQQQQAMYGGWQGQQQAQQYQYPQPGAAQRQVPDLAEILKQFGGQQQPPR
ncbi:hypothetical protein LTR37_001054 [Vermiconidia calcicola]|uniref:Uncharacterized protein n=1 Tax=Vermiconidia calcicola TaxID=1690605 RepID=A0ACC3NY89_9PEZI|nr:hypothetical protein LTR37_001054 [Vermiconidia calcicola]